MKVLFNKKKISEDKLKAHFAKVGVITEAKLKYTKDGKFRQFAFVGYKNESDAEKAIEYFNNTYIDASKIIVSLFFITQSKRKVG